jgi:hypothetical protein
MAMDSTLLTIEMTGGTGGKGSPEPPGSNTLLTIDSTGLTTFEIIEGRGRIGGRIGVAKLTLRSALLKGSGVGMPTLLQGVGVGMTTPGVTVTVTATQAGVGEGSVGAPETRTRKVVPAM